MNRLRSLTLALAAAIGCTLALCAPAAAQTKLKMVLNWKYQGPQGWFFLADDRGYFKAEGLEVQMDQGNGSGAAVPLVANGTYDVGEPIKGNGGALHVNPATDQYANPDSFQIISAGQDGRFGFALPSSGPPPLPAKLFPIGGGYSPYDGDNIVNFTEKKSLDDAKP